MKMDWLRTSLIAAIAVLSFLLIIRWNDYKEQHTPSMNTSSSLASQPSSDVVPQSIPTVTANDHPDVPGTVISETTKSYIQVKTDVLELTIDPLGGDIVKVALPTFYAKLNKADDPFILLNQNEATTYIARSGLIGVNGSDTNDSRPLFSTPKTLYVLPETEDRLSVILTYAQTPKVTLYKSFEFTRGSHLINVSYHINNNSDQPWEAALYGQIKRDGHNPNVSSAMGIAPFLGAATNTQDINYHKITLNDLNDEPYLHKKQGGWLAMVQHYFLSAWIPSPDTQNEYKFFKQTNSPYYFFQFVTPSIKVAPGEEGNVTAQFYAGPKTIRVLEKVAPYLDLTVDYSFLWWIAKPIYFTLEKIHEVVKNWGISIILLTLLIKIIFFYPSAASYKSMAKMRKLQPKMAELKERFGEDRQKFSAEMMKLYRAEKVNPLGGCLPILIQMPVFLALYWVLMESVELRQAPFFLWIQDLSVKDPYFVLPLIMGVTMWFQQKLNPTPPDPMQAKIMQMMPILFTFLFLFFPAGLVLYWVVNNTLSITQQYLITRSIEKAA